MSNKFKVGQKYKILDGYGNLEIYIGKIGEITEIKEQTPTWAEITFYNGSKANINLNSGCMGHTDRVELVEEEPKKNECEPCSGTNGVTTLSGDYSMSGGCTIGVDTAYGSNLPFGMYPMYQSGCEVYITNNNKTTIMSKITTFAKNLVLSADEKLLRKYGLKDECGEFTDEAESLVMAKLVKENEAYLVELATAMQVEESKK